MIIVKIIIKKTENIIISDGGSKLSVMAVANHYVGMTPVFFGVLGFSPPP